MQIPRTYGEALGEAQRHPSSSRVRWNEESFALQLAKFTQAETDVACSKSPPPLNGGPRKTSTGEHAPKPLNQELLLLTNGPRVAMTA
jgi:hypothetical protein